MSLFQARCFWNASTGSKEDSDADCLCVANIDNEPSSPSSGGGSAGFQGRFERNKIITASYQGILRIYHPKKRDYKIEDLCLEQDMGAPIIQMAVGRFTNSSIKTDVQLAVLHPLKLCVYSVSCANAQIGFSTNLCYFHTLTRPAFNMCVGPFGGGRDLTEDYFCVQSLDGVLTFYEQDSLAFSRQLPNCLLPGPITYCSKLDLFLVGSCDMTLDAYRYTVLAAAADNTIEQLGAQGLQQEVAGKKVQVDWSFNLGEHAHRIEVAKSKSMAPNPWEIIVIGEYSIFYIKESGGLYLQKRHMEEIATSRAYAREDDSTNLILVTRTNHLLVYREMQLIWCARLQTTGIPVEIIVEELVGIKGMLTTLNEEGNVQVSYLGTEPPAETLINTEMKELDYEMMEEEHQQLLRTIRRCHLDGKSEPKEKLEIYIERYPESFDTVDPFEDRHANIICEDDVPLQTTISFCIRSCHGGARNITVTVGCESDCFLTSLDRGFDLPELAADEPIMLDVSFWQKCDVMCFSLQAQISVSFFSPNNEPRSVILPFRLPLWFVTRSIPPVKSANFKIHFDTSADFSLTNLFSDVINQPNVFPQVSSTANIMSIQYIAGKSPVTVLYSKSAARISVQGTEFTSLWILCDELKRRLKAMDSSVVLAFQDSLPLQDYFSLVDDHFTLLKHLEMLRKDMEDRMHQYRVVQKRLLVRYKDRNPAPVSSLDVLIQLSFESLIRLIDACDEAERAKNVVAGHLGAATELLLFLMNSRFDFDDENAKLLRIYFSPIIDDNWEEQVSGALGEALRTSLAATQKDAALYPPTFEGSITLKKNLTEVIDRLASGARLNVTEDDEEDNEEEEGGNA